MKIKFLGTAAYEGIPALYCRCGICKNAMEKGGKEIRTRSQALINDDLLIDYPPDTYAHYLTHKFDLPVITHMLITHSHSDHFYLDDLRARLKYYANPVPERLSIYCNETVLARFNANSHEVKMLVEESVTLHRAMSFQPFQAGAYRVTALPALHARNEECLFFLIEKDGKAMIYGNDTGIFPDTAFDYLKNTGVYLNLCSLDCTSMRHKDGNNHMGLVDCIEVRDRLVKQGNADEKTVFILHHFSHNGGWTHEEMAAQGEKNGFLTSYDGMEVAIK